jgi:hypothetical protein
MLRYLLEYEVKPGENLPGGLPRQRLVVLSPIWRGPALHLEYPDGEVEILVGRRESGKPCDLQVFWTRENPQGPAVCLAIGGNAGLRLLSGEEGGAASRGLAFLALAESLIPPEVLAVIGPRPSAEPLLLG